MASRTFALHPIRNVMARDLRGTSLALLAAAVLFGTLLPEVWRIGLAASGVTVAATIVGPSALLQIVLFTAGLSLASITDNQRVLLPQLGGFNLDGLRLLATVGGFAWLAFRVRNLISRSHLVGPYLALLAAGTVSLVWAPDRAEGLRLLLKLAFPLIGFFLAAWVQMSGRGDKVQKHLAMGALFATAVNFCFSLITASTKDQETYMRYTAGIGHNLFGHFSAITALACYAWWPERKSSLFGICAGILTLQLVATGSRTAFVSLGVGVLLLEAVRRRWLRGIAFAAVGVCFWILVPALGPRTEARDVMSSDVATTQLLDEVNLSGRLLIWNDVWTGMVVNSGPLGLGIGSAASYLASRYDTVRHVHNEFLRVLAEGGPIGLVLFLAAYLWPMIWAVRMTIRSRGIGATPFALASAAIAMFLVASGAENTFELYATYTVYPWIFLGLASQANV